MLIKFERSGGFAGMHMESTIDSNDVTVEEAYELFKMVVKAHFFELPSTPNGSNGMRDHFQCKLTIEHGPQTHTVETDDTTAPEELKPLIEVMTQVARSSRTRTLRNDQDYSNSSY